MFVVIDANELISLMIRGSRYAREIFLSEKIKLIAPEFIIEEFANNKEEILLKTRKTEQEFLIALSILKDRINLVPESEFADYMKSACSLIPLHQKDAVYFALALKYDCPIWSEEKVLKKQNQIKVLDTLELYENFRQLLDN